MTVAKKRRGLGRGLGALISAKPVKVDTEEVAAQEDAKPEGKIVNLPVNEAVQKVSDQESSKSESVKLSSDELVKFVPISSVSPNPEQPRKNFNEVEVRELSQSIKTMGVLQPIVVRTLEDQTFQIVAGERRWRAATQVGLKQLPVIIKNFNDQQALEVGLIENVQRSDLSPLEEAKGYDELMKRFNLTQVEVAEKVGKDRTTIANAVRLLKLPIEVQAFLGSGALSVGHAKAILSVKEPQLRVALAHKVVKERLSVRELERIVARKVNLQGGAGAKSKGKGSADSTISSGAEEVAGSLQKVLGTKVRIAEHSSGRGKVVIEYFSHDELSRIVDAICE